jgi:integrase
VTDAILEGRLLPAFGPAVNVRTLTPRVVAQYEKQRTGQVSAYTVANELAVLRHMLHLAKDWGYTNTVPDFTLPKKPEGRRRYLTEDELRRLLTACEQSRNPHLAAIVTLAVHIGMWKAEILGLEWERLDLASARIIPYDTKNGSPRGVPMNRAVQEVLGHKDFKMTLRYAHLSPAHLRGAVERLEGLTAPVATRPASSPVGAEATRA